MSQPNRALLVPPAWLQKLISREVQCVPKAINTRLQGEVLLAELGTGLVRANAHLTEARLLTETELATEPMQSVIMATGWRNVYGWFLTNIETLDQPWVIPIEARKTCAHWIPRQRWDLDFRAKPDGRRCKVVAKAWPKKIPRKSSVVQTMPRPRSAMPRAKGQKKRKSSASKVKRSPANAPATYSVCQLSRDAARLPMAEKIAVGRTAARLQHLAEMHLFHAPRQLHEPLQPKAGIFARHGDSPVYIVGTWMDTRRKRLMADVLPLHPQGDNHYAAFRKQIFSCQQSQLCKVGEQILSMRRKNLSKGKLLFDAEVAPAELDLSPSPGRVARRACEHELLNHK